MKKMLIVCQSGRLLTVLACAAWAACSTAWAETTTYYVTDDTYIDSRNSNSNYGAANGLKVFVNSVTPQPCRTLIELPTEFDAIPASNLISVMLWVYNYGGTSLTQNIELHPLTTSFTESGATWNTPDGVHSWSGGDYGVNHVDVSAPDHDAWYAFDITSMLQGSDRDSLLYHGLLLEVYNDAVAPSATTGQNFVSSENAGYSACHPYFAATIMPEPAPLIMLAGGLGAAALLWIRRWLGRTD